MRLTVQKARRLEQVARLYYEENKNQHEIAAALGVSRPLISRMLQEARDAGIVSIRIIPHGEQESPVLIAAKERFGLAGGRLTPFQADNAKLNESIAHAVMDCIDQLGGGRVGLGWGHIIGAMVRIMEKRPPARSSISHVVPMVGNSGISIRNYHSNENVRIVAHHAMATPQYLHTPAFAETAEELELWRKTENYKAVSREWNRLDIALVNIGNHPSTPDFASHARYGDLLSRRQAVGRMIAYYYTRNGEIIVSDTDYAVQIPCASLSRSRHVVGVCSANINRQTLEGALNTGLFTHVVACENLMQEVMDAVQS
ncbi:hypothetical protein LJC23_06370 [Desulfovibrio sp. OttesenSCG-928-I05]|nr:hypothetical protein [Desulfovibrio sp. OttesenSCG-928-I05]